MAGSCFLLKQENGRSLMFDCGILDTDALPYPNITPDEARQINYLFLSHAHKDHTGAVPYLLQLGFQGVIAASPETIRISACAMTKSGNWISPPKAARILRASR